MDVADTWTPGTGTLSGPMTLPRMMSVCCAAAPRAHSDAAANTARYNRRRTVTAPLLRVGRIGAHVGAHDLVSSRMLVRTTWPACYAAGTCGHPRERELDAVDPKRVSCAVRQIVSDGIRRHPPQTLVRRALGAKPPARRSARGRAPALSVVRRSRHMVG